MSQKQAGLDLSSQFGPLLEGYSLSLRKRGAVSPVSFPLIGTGRPKSRDTGRKGRLRGHYDVRMIGKPRPGGLELLVRERPSGFAPWSAFESSCAVGENGPLRGLSNSHYYFCAVIRSSRRSWRHQAGWDHANRDDVAVLCNRLRWSGLAGGVSQRAGKGYEIRRRGRPCGHGGISALRIWEKEVSGTTGRVKIRSP